VTSIPEQLERLAALLDRGLITREEFESQKRVLLAGPAPTPSTPGTTTSEMERVGAYRLGSLIGQGGMGVVHRGRHSSEAIAQRQGGDVAVKIMHAQFASNPDYRRRFEREASLGVRLDHPGIVSVHDFVVDGGVLAVVMEWVEGRPMSEVVGEAAGPIPWEQAWPLFRSLLEGVGYAHSQGVVHRDLKPENVLIGSDGAPRIIDFGISKDLADSQTRTGAGMGTVEYMAPEQYTDAKAVDHRADIYSLGMMLYEMLSGRLPWDANASQFEILEQKARRELRSPSSHCPGIPQPVIRALVPALYVDPAERYGSAMEYAAALAQANSEIQPSPEPAARPTVRRTVLDDSPGSSATPPPPSAVRREPDPAPSRPRLHGLLLPGLILSIPLALGCVAVIPWLVSSLASSSNRADLSEPRPVEGPAPTSSGDSVDPVALLHGKDDGERMSIAREALDRGTEKLEDHHLADGNLTVAIEQFEYARVALESVEYPGSLADDVAAKLAEAADLRDQKHRDTLFHYEKLKRSGDYREGKEELEFILRLIADEEDPRYRYAARELVQIEQLMGRSER